MNSGDSGNALVELIFAVSALLVPIALGLVALVSVTDGAVLAETTSREVARAFVLAESDAQAFTNADRVARIAFADAFRSYVPPRITCALDPCLTPGARVRVVVRFPVEVAWGRWTVRSEHVQIVDPWRAFP